MAETADLITERVLAACRGIRADEGYRTTPAIVTEGRLTFAEVGRFPAISVQSVRDRFTSFPARRRRRVVRLLVTAFVRSPKGANRFAAARAVLADVNEALMKDPSLGGAAVFALLREARVDAAGSEEGARGACIVEAVVHEDI